jgi:hypothetical protein
LHKFHKEPLWFHGIHSLRAMQAKYFVAKCFADCRAGFIFGISPLRHAECGGAGKLHDLHVYVFYQASEYSRDQILFLGVRMMVSCRKPA